MRDVQYVWKKVAEVELSLLQVQLSKLYTKYLCDLLRAFLNERSVWRLSKGPYCINEPRPMLMSQSIIIKSITTVTIFNLHWPFRSQSSLINCLNQMTSRWGSIPSQGWDCAEISGILTFGRLQSLHKLWNYMNYSPIAPFFYISYVQRSCAKCMQSQIPKIKYIFRSNFMCF